jgi:mevalonate kinase
MHSLVALTEEFFSMAFAGSSIDEEATMLLGKVMTAYHFCLDAMRRAGSRTNTLLGGLCGEQGFLGGKMAGAGPGGAVLLMLERNDKIIAKMRAAAAAVGATLLHADILERGHGDRCQGMRLHVS